jgi:hypothetical protein
MIFAHALRPTAAGLALLLAGILRAASFLRSTPDAATDGRFTAGDLALSVVATNRGLRLASRFPADRLGRLG